MVRMMEGAIHFGKENGRSKTCWKKGIGLQYTLVRRMGRTVHAIFAVAEAQEACASRKRAARVNISRTSALSHGPKQRYRSHTW